MSSPGHEWTPHEREGWSVCSRCGMVRNYDREMTTCSGALPKMARAAAAGQTIAQRVDLALALLDRIEDAPGLTGTAEERLDEALRCAAACEAVTELLAGDHDRAQITEREAVIWGLVVGVPARSGCPTCRARAEPTTTDARGVTHWRCTRGHEWVRT